MRVSKVIDLNNTVCPLPCDDLTCHLVPWICEVSRKTEISQLELASVVDQDVRAFYVPVYYTFSVEVSQTREHLQAKGLEMFLLKDKLGLGKNTRQVVVHVLKHHIHGA